MSMIGSTTGVAFTAGRFLKDDEKCIRETATIPSTHSAAITNGSVKYVPAGAVIPANDSTATGILYEDIDITKGAAMGAIVTEGTVYADKLPASVASAAVSALTKISFVEASPTITRPW